MFGNFAKIGRAFRGLRQTYTPQRLRHLSMSTLYCLLKSKFGSFLSFVRISYNAFVVYVLATTSHPYWRHENKGKFMKFKFILLHFIVFLLTVFHMNFQRNQKGRHIDLVPHMSRHFYNQVDKPLQ